MGKIQKTEVPLACVSSIFNKYRKAGTNIIPPPVENNPLTIPANNPIIIFFNIIKKIHGIYNYNED